MIGTAEAVKTYAFAIGDGGEIMSDVEASEDAGRDLDKQAKEYAQTFNVGYRDAFHQILSQPENVDLKTAYVGIHDEPSTQLYVVTPGEAGEEVDRLTREYIAQHGSDYSTAMKRVLADPANAELKKAYGS